MRQLFLDNGLLSVKQIAEPLLDEYAVLVLVHYSFVSSGTEMATIKQARAGFFSDIPCKVKKILDSIAAHGVEGTKGLVLGKLKGSVQSLGYSCSGQVIAVGKKVAQINVGDFVACAGAGYANHADIVSVPERLVVRVPEQQLLKHASITTLGAIALQGVRQADLRLAECVCVIGLGLIGQLTVQLAKASGCTVIGIDVVLSRVELAKQLGADYVYCVDQADAEVDIAFLTMHYGVDATIITATSDSSDILSQALRITRKKGRIVIVGDVGLQVDRDPFYHKEIDLKIACSYGPGRHDPQYERFGIDYPYAYVRWTEQRNMAAFIGLLHTGKIDVASLISAEVTLEQAEKAYQLVQKKEYLGIVLTFTDESRVTSYTAEHEVAVLAPPSFTGRFNAGYAEKMRVGLIGAGGFAKVKLLPIISKLKNAELTAIVDTDIKQGLITSRMYKGAKVCTLEDDLFRDDSVDVVVIASPHKYHAAQAIKALEYGKAVFLEKPMVTTFDQLEQFRALFKSNPELPLCVDYNRSFSPFMQKIKAALVQRTTPLMAYYRMNVGYLSKEHWVQTELGSGRIVGEACHIVELFCFLTDAQPVAVSVEALRSTQDDIFPTDNFSAQILFTDGSVCTLWYTSLGDAAIGKEYMELHWNGKTVRMDDYMRLEGYGLPSSFQEGTPFPDKGHALLMQLFFGGLSKKPYQQPISLSQLATAAFVTLTIDRLVCAGGGAKELV